MATEAAISRTSDGDALEAEYLDRARAAATVIAEEAGAIETGRELTPRALAAMHDAQLFRLTLPKSLGGAELEPTRLAEATEIIAGADASAAWCLGQGFGCAMSAAFMDAEPAAHVFGPADAVLAWGAGAQGTAVAADGGYHVSGTWRFASGGKHATWLGAHCKVVEADGSPRLTADGKPRLCTALVPRETATILDDWYVMGLKGTRSEGFSLEDRFVEAPLTLDREDPNELRLDEPLYRFPTTSVYASAFSGVALGIAHAALEDLVELARNKTARGARTALKDSAVFQTRLAELEAKLGSARAYQQQTVRGAWREVVSAGDITMPQRIAIRLATTYAINEATSVTADVYRLAGSDAIFEGKPFERRFRDAHAVSQQVQGRQSNYETVGRYRLGLDAGSQFI